MKNTHPPGSKKPARRIKYCATCSTEEAIKDSVFCSVCRAKVMLKNKKVLEDYYK